MTGPGNASGFVDGVVTALWHMTEGRGREAMGALEAADPGGFVACYTLAGVILGHVPGIERGGVTVRAEGDTPAGDQYMASLGAFLAAVGNDDVAGAGAVFFTDEATSGQMIADLLKVGAELTASRR